MTLSYTATPLPSSLNFSIVLMSVCKITPVEALSSSLFIQSILLLQFVPFDLINLNLLQYHLICLIL